MKTLQEVLDLLFCEKDILKIIFTNNRIKNFKYKKIIMENKSSTNFYFQNSLFFNNQVIHENINSESEFKNSLIEKFNLNFKNINIITKKENLNILVNKNKEYKIIYSKNNLDTKKITSHNKNKNYILQEGEKIEWLVKLGIMTKDFKIIQSKMKKFKQINRFLEMVQDISSEIPDNGLILDFGCGKSYLTFAIYYFFNTILNKNVTIIGMDLKEDVVNYCNQLALDFDFKNLSFITEDIKNYNNNQNINMVITLHACDTATDYALFNAIKWNSEIIMSVPCCQHEINNQIKNSLLNPILKYGILKERFSSLITDSIRGQLLEICGYKTQIIEFIDTEHTPKNIMIRSVKRNNKINTSDLKNEFLNLKNEFQINPTLYKLLNENNYIDF